MADILLRMEELTKHFPVNRGIFAKTRQKVHALDQVSLTLYKREIVGVVGESGCGKSTLAKTLLRLIEPTSGSIHFEGRDITRFNKTQMHEVRRNMQFIFQDPFSSLNPRKKVLISLPSRCISSGSAQEKSGSSGFMSCSRSWDCQKSMWNVTRTNSAGASGSASELRARLR